MFDFLKRLRARPAPEATAVHADVGAALVAHAALPEGLASEDAMMQPRQVDGDPAPGRPATDHASCDAPRDVFVVPGGLGLPALALVNVRDPQARVELWALDAEHPRDVAAFVTLRDLRFPAGRDAVGWQITQAAALPRLQCLLVLRHDAEPRTALLAVLDVASGVLRELGVAEPDPFVHGAVHGAALRAPNGAVLVRWHRGRVALGRWGDVAAADAVVLFSARERDGLPVLTLALADGNIRAWGLLGNTLWMQAIDGRLHPSPRIHAWSLDLSRVL